MKGSDFLKIIKFEDKYSNSLSQMISDTIFEINIKDYPLEDMKCLAESYSPENIVNISNSSNMYIAINNSEILGCGAVKKDKDNAVVLAIFVNKNHLNKNIGRKIMDIIENDEISKNSNKIIVPASITAAPFYERLGYKYKGNKKVLYNDDIYYMEKSQYL